MPKDSARAAMNASYPPWLLLKSSTLPSILRVVRTEFSGTSVLSTIAL
jgi:hypothetical protein